MNIARHSYGVASTGLERPNTRRARTRYRRPQGDRRGAILALVGVSMVGLMGVMAFAIEMGSLERQRRIAQTAADAGALAGANELYRGSPGLVDTSAKTETSRNGFTNGANGVVVTVSKPPVSGYYVGNNNYVEVQVSRTLPAFFGGLLGRNSTVVGALAVAGIDAPSQNCLYTLDPGAEKALNVSATTSRLDAGCGVVVNSSHPTKAVLIESAGTFTADNLAVVGGIDASGGTLVVDGSSQTGVPPSPNPLGYLQMPAFDPAQCDYTDLKVDSYGAITVLNPGIYCSTGQPAIEITSNGTASLNPGLYILRGGGLKMSGGLIAGTGVTFVNTNATVANGGADKFGKIEMGSASRAAGVVGAWNATLNRFDATGSLSAMTTGSLAGILFYQDPAAGKAGTVYENIIASGSNASFTGTLYFPTQPIELGASGTTTTINGGVVAMTVKVSSDSQVTMTGLGGGAGSVYFPFKRVSLVE